MGLRFFCIGGGGGSRKLAVALPGAHTLSENPPPVSGIQAYIVYLLGRRILGNLLPSGLEAPPVGR